MELPFGITSNHEVLVVDDHPIELELCELTLKQAQPGVKVMSFRSGLDIISYLQEKADVNNPPTMMLLDLRMPRMDGFEVLNTIREQNLKICPVIVFSTSNLTEDRERAEALGADEFIEKPVDLDDGTSLFKLLLGRYGLNEYAA